MDVRPPWDWSVLSGNSRLVNIEAFCDATEALVIVQAVRHKGRKRTESMSTVAVRDPQQSLSGIVACWSIACFLLCPRRPIAAKLLVGGLIVPAVYIAFFFGSIYYVYGVAFPR
jgi:hypothetical protein